MYVHNNHSYPHPYARRLKLGCIIFKEKLSKTGFKKNEPVFLLYFYIEE
jgi:hypothetical protein